MIKLFSVTLLLAAFALTARARTFPTFSVPTAPDHWKAENVPFSFEYGGKPSSQILATWQASDEAVASGGGRIHRYYYTDPATHLKVTAEVRLFPDFPGTVDWVLRFRNEGDANTPIIENILPLDWAMPSSRGDCFIRHDRGSDARADDFQPLQEQFGPGGNDHLESPGGNPSSGNTLPFFNLQTGDHGVIGAIGWTGGWKADFANARDGKSITLAAGMKRTHLLLHPGEEIRTPRIVLQNWTGGDWREAQNGWRHLLLAHYVPKDDGKAMMGPVMAGSWGGEDIKAKIAFVRWVHDHRIPIDLYAVDAGWYGASFGSEQDPTNPWWKNRGDWFPSPLYYPHGLKPLGEACRAAGIGFMLWIEPETSMPGRKIIEDHPDWYLHSNHPVNPGVALANYSNPEALRGITDMVSGFITDFGMTWYRQDFNIPPDEYWALNDKPDRIGMTEIGHVEGLYQLWDELLAKHPGLHIDNCASGGRRIDIETMSRSFIVWRTDHGYTDTLAEQAQTQALAPWVPENMGFETYTDSNPGAKPGPYTTPEHLYLMRLGYDAGYGFGVRGLNPGVTAGNDAWIPWLKQAIGEYREVQPYFFGDFYPLLPYSLDSEAWTAWQWDRPGKRDGLVMVLRRPKSPFTTMELNLRHLDPAASYWVEIRTGYDKGPLRKMKGSDLADLPIQLPDAPSSTLIFYRQEAASEKPGALAAVQEEPRLKMLPADPQPAIHGPRITGATPGRPFLFSIAATGLAPLTYAAQNLPEGLKLDEKTGIITGALSRAGVFPVVLMVSGPGGTARRELTVVGGSHKLALTPPMGWNSWNVWGNTVDEGKVKAAADEMISAGLIAHGYQYVNIDQGWQGQRDAQGNILTNPQFPDMSALCGYVHRKGLRIGIYSSPGPQTCGPYEGSYRHEDQDARTYAKWGFDYLKYDWCSYDKVVHGDRSLPNLKKPYQVMRAALDKVNRDLVYSLCQYGWGDVWKWGAEPDIQGNCWRTHDDIDDVWTGSSGWGHDRGVYDIIQAEVGHEKYAGPGHWNDPDMLMVGVVGFGTTHPTQLTPNEQIVHVSMWCMFSSPLLIGCDMTKLDAFTRAILTNDEVLEIDQDPLGKPASRISQDRDLREVWSRELFDGTRAVALLNGGAGDQTLTVHWGDLGLSGPQAVRDLWLHEEEGSFADGYSVVVPSHGIALLKVGSPAK